MARRVKTENGSYLFEGEMEQTSICAEAMYEHFRHSDGGLMRIVVERYIASKDFAVLEVLNETILKEREDEWEGFSDLRREIESAALRKLAGHKGKREVSKEDFGMALGRLFETAGYDRNPLLSQNSDWLAVFRVAIDVELAQDNAYSDFIALIKNLDLPFLPKSLSVTNISNIYVGIYTKPVREWTEEAYLKSRATTGARLAFFRRKQKIAQLLLDLLS